MDRHAAAAECAACMLAARLQAGAVADCHASHLQPLHINACTLGSYHLGPSRSVMNRGARRQRGSSYGHSAALAFSLRVRLIPFAAVQWLSSLRGASAAGSICVGLVRFCLLSIFETSGCTREEDDWDDVTKR